MTAGKCPVDRVISYNTKVSLRYGFECRTQGRSSHGVRYNVCNMMKSRTNGKAHCSF